MSVAVTMRPVLRVVEHHVLVYRRTWRGTVFSTFFSPILFLAAMGIGLGTFVDDAEPAGIAGVGYLAFLAPGLLVAQAMQTAAFESTYPVMAGIRWLKTYVAMILSPLDARHVATGQLLWTGLRVTFGAVIFVAVMTVFGAVDPGRAVLLLPVATLTGLAFAAPIQAFAASQRNDNPFASLFRFVIMPMFIFSGTFFPITQLPELLQVVAVLTPLWHAVALARGIALDVLDPALAAVNVAYLSAFIVAGLLWSYRAFSQKLAG
ncbi:MAG TPA: ABC transporter permease [Candidatus Limnocylindrales bacterium]|nr:ABC transporter permease [Candidatus Limnocylindrales bacterium]